MYLKVARCILTNNVQSTHGRGNKWENLLCFVVQIQQYLVKKGEKSQKSHIIFQICIISPIKLMLKNEVKQFQLCTGHKLQKKKTKVKSKCTCIYVLHRN